VRRLILIICCVILLPFTTSQAQNLPPVDPSNLTLPITIASSQVSFPIDNLLIDGFVAQGFPGGVSITNAGSDVGIDQYCNGSVDIISVDRIMTNDEIARCRANGRDPIAFQIGADALVIAMGILSPFADDVTTEEVVQIYSSATNWADVRPEWPSSQIVRLLPEAGSRDLEAFAERFFSDDPLALTNSPNLQLAPEQTRLEAAEADPSAIAVFPFSYYSQFAGTNLKALRLDGAAPTVDSITNGTYPLATPILLYTDQSTMVQNTSVTALLNYYINNVESQLRGLGYFPNREGLQLASNTWLQIVTDQEIVLETGTVTTTDATTTDTTAEGEAIDSEVIAGGDGEVIEETGGAPEAETTDSGTSDVIPISDALPLLIDARADLELLMVTTQGVNRPVGWNGSLDVGDPSLPILIRLDLELLAGTALGANSRPVGWFGAVPSTSFNIARDIRHDLELLADELLGFNERPEGWTGSDPLFRCSRSTQALVNMLDRGGVFTLNIDTNSPDFCFEAEVQASQFSEVNLLANVGNEPIFAQSAEVLVPGAITIETNFAVSFLDRGGRLSVGVVPIGTAVRPVARSYSQFSRMVVVEGNDFLVFLDYRDTSMTQEQFRELGDIDSIALDPYCLAEWCG